MNYSRIACIMFMAQPLFIHAMSPRAYTPEQHETETRVFENIVCGNFDMAQGIIASLEPDDYLTQSLARAERLAHQSDAVSKIMQNILLLDVLPDQVLDIFRMIDENIRELTHNIGADASIAMHADMRTFVEEINARLPHIPDVQASSAPREEATKKTVCECLMDLQNEVPLGMRGVDLAKTCDLAIQKNILELLANAQKLNMPAQIEEMLNLLECALVLSDQLGTNGRCARVLIYGVHEATLHVQQALEQSYGASILVQATDQLRQTFAMTLNGAIELTGCAHRDQTVVVESALRFVQKCLAPVRSSSIWGWMVSTTASSISGIAGMPDPYVLQSRAQLVVAASILLGGLGLDIWTQMPADMANNVAHRLCPLVHQAIGQIMVATGDDIQVFIHCADAILLSALILANRRGAQVRDVLADLTQLLDKINKVQSEEAHSVVTVWARERAALLTEIVAQLNS